MMQSNIQPVAFENTGNPRPAKISATSKWRNPSYQDLQVM
jgi:hypothetical protein